MLRLGLVTKIEPDMKSGVITDYRGTEWFFTVDVCKDNKLPRVHTKVLFKKDKDYKFTEVADEVIIEAA